MSEAAPRQKEDLYQDDEISLKDLILKLKEFWFELWKNWYLIVLIIIPFLVYNLYKHYTHIKIYDAELTFMVNDEEGGGAGGMASMLGTFGLGGVGGGDYNLEKMLALLKSRKIVQNVIVTRASIDGKEDYFGNHMIYLLELQDRWKEETPELSKFTFVRDSIDGFNESENTVLKLLHSYVIGNSEKGRKAMLESKVSEETGILTLNMLSEKEEFSIKFLERLYDNLSNYYVDKSIEKQQNTFNIVAAKADSLETEMRSAEYALASFMDKNRGLYNRKDQLNQFRLEAKVKMIGAAYAKVVEQREIAEFSLNDQKPVVQIIDLPISPLEPSKSSLFKNIILACLIGGFLGAFFVIGRKIVHDTLA